jgi:hypothetical protein
MNEWDRLGWDALHAGLFGVTIAALGTDIFSDVELMAISLLMIMGGVGGVAVLMASYAGLVGGTEEVIGQ